MQWRTSSASYYVLLGLARTIYIRYIYGTFGKETKDTVIYGVYIRFWPTLHVMCVVNYVTN
jgi:hypothetical protein